MICCRRKTPYARSATHILKFHERSRRRSRRLKRDCLRANIFMDRRRYGLTLALLITSFAGGAIGSRITESQPIQAQKVAAKDNAVIVPASGLYFKTPDGKAVARLFADQDGGNLQIFNSSGVPVAWLGAAENGGYLSVNNTKGKKVAGLSAAPSGGSLGVSDNEARSVGSMFANLDGGHLSIGRSNGKIGVGMFADKDGGSLNVYNRDAESVWSAP